MKRKYKITKKDLPIRWIGTYSISNGLIHVNADYVEGMEKFYSLFGYVKDIKWQKTDMYAEKVSFPVADIGIIQEVPVEKDKLTKTEMRLRR